MRKRSWDDDWDGVDEPWEFRPEIVWVHHVWAKLFRELLPPAPASCLEVGAGGSQYLPWIASALGLRAYGLDHSEKGLDLCRRALTRAGASGDLVLADFFDDVLRPRSFDAVVSFGFVDHFPELPTSEVLARMAALVRPGGVLLCTVPNLRGLIGWITRFGAPATYHHHVFHDSRSLRAAFVSAGIADIRHCGTFGSFNLQAALWDRLLRPLSPERAAAARRLIGRIDLAVWARLYRRGRDLPSSFLAPHILVSGRVP